MKLDALFANHMVLQREQPIRIFGTGKGEAIITLNGASCRICATDDTWEVELPSMAAGGPYTLQATLNNDIYTIEDVYIGDVWLAAGQSNMAMPLRETLHTADDLAEEPLVRYCTVAEDTGELQPWVLCGPDTTPHFSAIGGHFARLMAQQHGIAIGVISCSRGASCIESWIDKKDVLGTPLELPLEKRFPDAALYCRNGYGDLYDFSLSQLLPYTLRGVLWYQGESNCGPHDGAIYRQLLEKLISCWRRDFRQPELPFLLVQLTRFGAPEGEENQWPLIRQQQLEASRSIPYTAMVTTTDLGQSDAIHPVRKKEVAERLFLAAQNQLFGESAEYCGPLPQAICREGAAWVITFTHAAGLHLRGELEDICCRTIAGESIPVSARLSDDRLLITVPAGQEPREFRAWYRNDCRVTLYNAAGFPASPFCLPVSE